MVEFCAVHKIKPVLVLYVLIQKNLKDISLKAKRNRSRVRTLFIKVFTLYTGDL